MEARMSQASDKLYNPERDISHCFADLVRITCARVSENSWYELAEADKHVKDDDIAKAMQSLSDFATNRSPNPDMEQVLDGCGWFDIPVRARAHVLANLGVVVMCYYYSGVRMVTVNGIGPHVADIDLPLVANAAATALCNSTRVGRAWRLFWTRLRKAWEALTGRQSTSHLDNIYGQISYRDILLKYNDELAKLNERFENAATNRPVATGPEEPVR